MEPYSLHKPPFQIAMLSFLLFLLTVLGLHQYSQAHVISDPYLQSETAANQYRCFQKESYTTHLLSFSEMASAFGPAWEPPKERIRNNVIFPLPPSPLPEESSLLTNQSLPTNTDYMPEVGNGHLATVVGSDSLFMNGLYNGANLSSHRARIPSPSGYSIQSDSVRPSGLARTYSLDVGRGIFTETYQGGGVKVTLRTYAHSTLSNLLVSELALSRDDVNKEVKVNVKVNPGSPSEDVEFQKTTLGMLRGLTREAEYPELAPRTEFFLLTAGYLQGNITMSPNSRGETYLALAVLGHDKDIVLAEYALAMQAWESGQLLPLHTEGWTKFWNRGRIDIGGNIDMARLTYASLYYILSSLPLANDSGPSWPFFGVSPGGLAHGSRGKDYLGHIFWDQDTWIYPGVALLHPDLGRRVVETRTRTLDAARLLAKRTGYKGARFPWESAFTGLETCPADPYGEREIHINGDISFMFRQYWQLTHDMSLMRDGKGAELVWGVADFWASRVTQDRQTGAYRILGVMPPDEWHPLVNDSAYTNNIAIISLEFANQMKRIMGQPENPQWSEISARMVRPYDAVKDFHPEFDGFDPRGRTKQADVVLLGFPLMVDMKPSTRQNDLTIYDLTTPQGPAPAMTWGMFLVGWLELGDEKKAETLLKRSIKNAQEPFQVWTENADGEGAVNFLTGMGGYLQSVLFGYGGCRIHDDLITFEPRLMPNVTRMRFVGLSYRGCSIDIEYDAEKLSLTMTSIDKGHGGLRVRFQEVGQWKDLVVGQRVDKKKQGFDLQSK